MGSAKKIVSGFFWTTLLNITNGIYGFISVPLLIGYFGKSDYGLISLALSVNVYLNLMDMGLNSTNVRYFSDWATQNAKDKVQRLFGTSLTIYGIIGLVNALIILLISLYANEIFSLSNHETTIIQHLFYVLSLSAFISWFTSCFDQIIRGHEYVGWLQKMTLLPKLLQIIILILTLIIGLSIEMYFALTTFSMLVIVPIMICKIYKIAPYISFIPRFDKDIFRQILSYSLSIFSFGFFQFSAVNLRPVILGIQGSVESVAEYRILNAITNFVILLGGASIGILLPSVTKAVATGNHQAQQRIVYDGTRYICILLVFSCFGVICIAPELLEVYVGKNYIPLSFWLILWLIILTLNHNQAISALILAGTDIRSNTIGSIAASLIGIVSCWFAVPIWGVGGTVIGYGMFLLSQMGFYYLYHWPRKMKIDSLSIFLRIYCPTICLSALIAFPLLFYRIDSINPISTIFIKGGIFTLLYTFCSYFLLSTSNRKELGSLIQGIRLSLKSQA